MSDNSTESKTSVSGESGHESAAMQRWRMLVLISFYGLILNFAVIGATAFDSLRLSSLFIALVPSLPLLAFAPMLHSNHLRGYAWLSFLILLYFIFAVQLSFAPASRIAGLVQVTLTSALFTGLMFYIRTARRDTGARL